MTPGWQRSEGRAASAGRRTASRRPRPDRRASMPGAGPSASESLADADIDAERRVAVALVQRDADIEPRRTEVGVIAHAGAGADSRRHLREVRQGVGVGAARIDEGHGAERLADALAELEAALDDAGAAERIVEGVARARALIGEAAHRTATARIEQLIEWDVGVGATRDTAERSATGQHRAAVAA